MRIEIEWSVDHYRADCKDLPGSPPVGLGATPEMAVACLFWRLLLNDHLEGKGSCIRHFNMTDPLVVNGVVWRWPDSYLKDGHIDR